MRPARVRTWREWLFETLAWGGYLSLRPLPTTEAERNERTKPPEPPEDITRLNIDAHPTKGSNQPSL